MPDNQSSDSVKEQAQKQTPDTRAANSPFPPDKPDTTDANPITNQGVQEEVKAIGQRVGRAERWMIGLTGAIAFFGLCSAIVGFLQWSVMSGQLKVMSETRADTRAIADATIAEMRRQTENMRIANQQSEKSLGAVVDQFHLDQRAWMSADVSLPEIEVDKPLVWDVSVLNSGKTFAQRTVISPYVSFSFRELTEEEMIKGAIAIPPVSVALLAPNRPYQVTNAIPAGDISRIKQRLGNTGFTYMWGDITYRDVFKRPHITRYCGYRCAASGDRAFIQCKFHTDAD